MKRLIPFISLALAATSVACGSETISEAEGETPSFATISEQPPEPPDTIYDESTGETQDVAADGTTTKMKVSEYSNDLFVRMAVCKYIPYLIDTNPVTGQGIYLIKWDCPPGFL